MSAECCKICGPPERRVMQRQLKSAAAMWLVLGAGCGGAFAQTLPSARCGSETPAAFCSAVRGARAEGWPAQSRSEVHGAARDGGDQPAAGGSGRAAGALMRGGNAIDAAVATAARAERRRADDGGRGRRLFAVIYIAQGAQGLRAECERHGADAGRRSRISTSSAITWNPTELGTRLRHAGRRHPAGHRARRRLGLGGRAQALRQADFQGGPGAGGRICGERLPGFRAHRA